MATMDKDLEELKKEHKELSDQLRRGAVLSLTVLSVFVISFSRACEKANENEVKNTVCQITKLSEKTRRDEDISYIFENFESSAATCADPCPMPTPTPTATPTPMPSPLPSPQPSPLPEASPDPTQIAIINPQDPGAESSPELSESEKKILEDCQSKLEADLETSAGEWFRVEPPIPGVKVNIDLRYWVVLLPPLYFLCAIYLHMLRMKVRVVEAVAAHRIEESTTDDVSSVSKLYFDKQSRYKRFPARLAATIFGAVYLFFPLYLLKVGYSVWMYLSLDSMWGFVFVFGVLTLYSVSYGHLVTNRFSDEIARLTRQPPRANFIRIVRTRVSNVVQAIGRWVHPRVSLSLGSVLLFLTLGLAITQDSCEEKRYKGYDILMDNGNAYWYPATGFFGGADPAEAFEGRIVYGLALLLGLAAIMLVLLPWLYHKLSHRLFRKILLILTGGFVVFTLMDFSAAYLFLAPWEGINRLIIWTILMLVWIFHLFSKRPERRDRWKRIRALLLVLTTPFIVIAWLYALTLLGLPGLLVYITGVHLLFFGMLQVHQRSLETADDASLQTFPQINRA